MIDVGTAGKLLDFGARIGAGHRADEQLEGAVALHNILQKNQVAYLADEVGMGKTYVALGAMALFRHFNPNFRLLVIAPRENIQRKWIKELGNFVSNNVRFPDLRVKSVDGKPARAPVACGNLMSLIEEVTADPDRDFFVRLSSFSLALSSADKGGWERTRNTLRDLVPWIPRDAFSLANKDEFKRQMARALCCILPKFDLVIVDEGHNLKHGCRDSNAARNQVLSRAMGHPDGLGDGGRFFPQYAPRAGRLLLLSATPLEESFRHVWNQLDVFGLAGSFGALVDDTLDDEEKKEVARKFLIRRVTSIRVPGGDRTKNQYRREWRAGGVHRHDEPIYIEDDRQRLIVALVQKKVAEVLGSEKFNNSFQIGMLASFESFMETAKLERPGSEDGGTFDDADQSDDELEREGVDVRDVNRLAGSYRRRFGTEMPHPKMDALVESLADAWRRGRKALVFVRRVASVTELKRKLDEKYDSWLLRFLEEQLPAAVQVQFQDVVARYRTEKQRRPVEMRGAPVVSGQMDIEDEMEETADVGGPDTFFSWFFRGKGPKGVISGANVQRRFIQRGSVYATFFEDNHVMALLEGTSGTVFATLAEYLGFDEVTCRERLRQLAARYLSRRAKKHAGADRMMAAQAAALELLKIHPGPLKEKANCIWRECFETSRSTDPADEAPDVSEGLEQRTLFSELRQPRWTKLRESLWPEPQHADERKGFREQELRRQLLAAAARLGHPLIDLYVLTIGRLKSLEPRTLDSSADGASPGEGTAIDDYLTLLESQRCSPLRETSWGAFHELSEISANFDLILDMNAERAWDAPLPDTAKLFGFLLREQQPVGGMSGEVNKTLVQQFRMPGYPFVLVSTDLLQEGEDLHAFCSEVYHYGASWTPSAMEQRIGRIDRVRSQTDRRLSALVEPPVDDELLQVYFPHLSDTVEVLQVQRVLERMDTFLRLMHQGLTVPQAESRSIDVGRELSAGRRVVEPIREHLKSAFPIPDWARRGSRPGLLVEDDRSAQEALARFQALCSGSLRGLPVDWEDDGRPWVRQGTTKLPSGRRQPFSMNLKSLGDRLIIRCVSPVGKVSNDEERRRIGDFVRTSTARIGASPSNTDGSFNLTVENDVLLGDPSLDEDRVGLLLLQVADEADELERMLCPGKDQSLADFREQLREEAESNDE